MYGLNRFRFIVSVAMLVPGCTEQRHREFNDSIAVRWVEGGLAAQSRSHFMVFRFQEGEVIGDVSLGMDVRDTDTRGPIFRVEEASVPDELYAFTNALLPVTPDQWVGWGCLDEHGREDSQCFDNADILLTFFSSPVFFFDLESDTDAVRQEIAEKAVRAIVAVYRDGRPATERDAELAQEERFAIPDW